MGKWSVWQSLVLVTICSVIEDEESTKSLSILKPSLLLPFLSSPFKGEIKPCTLGYSPKLVKCPCKQKMKTIDSGVISVHREIHSYVTTFLQGS